MNRHLFRSIGLLTVALAVANDARAQSFTVNDLGTQDGGFSSARAINKAGQIAGIARTADDSIHPVLWDHGTPTDLGTLPGFTFCVATAINASAEVVGWCSSPDQSTSRAFLWSTGTMSDLGTLGGPNSRALGINDDGQVVGMAGTNLYDPSSGHPGLIHAFTWQNGMMTDAGADLPPGFASVGQAINNLGQIAITAHNAAGGPHSAWQSYNGAVVQVVAFSGDTTAWGIDALGRIVGSSENPSHFQHAFRWDAGEVTDLDTLGSANSIATASNLAGDVVGSAPIGAPPTNYRAFLWHQGAMTNLQGHVQSGFAAWQFFIEALGINEVGEIVGDGIVTSGATHGFLLTPILDTTPPTVSCGSADGFWQASEITISCSASDLDSGLADPSDAAFFLTTAVPVGMETANAITGTRTVCDRAGNCTTAGPVSGNKVDKRPPSISISTPTATAYLLNQTVVSGYSCTDAGSSVSVCAGSVPTGTNFYTASVGVNTFLVNATDAMGNASSASVGYSVKYTSGGACLGSPGHQILQPVNADGTSVFKKGSTVPSKFRVCDANGNSIGTAGVIASFRLIQTISGTVTDVDEAVDSSTPDTAFRWSPAEQLWIFNLGTKALTALTTYVYRIALLDGSVIDFRFGLK